MGLYSCLISGIRVCDSKVQTGKLCTLGETCFKILLALVINLVNCNIASGLLFLNCVCAFVVCQC